ncbi:MAG: uroporphyrinogen-III synthase [Alphaproteobacteria bacterium]
MAPQSCAFPVLLTRPAAQSDRFAQDLRNRFPWVRTLVSPLMEATFLHPPLPLRDWAGVIFTSETGVQSAMRIAADRAAWPELAFCVGDQTARVAREAGFQAVSAQGDGMALARMIRARQVNGPLLYLHGEEIRVDLAQILNAAGIETMGAISYRQNARALTEAAVTELRGQTPVIAPVFSARTGKLLADEYARIAGTAPLLVVGISAAACADLPATERRIARQPDATTLLEAMGEWLT